MSEVATVLPTFLDTRSDGFPRKGAARSPVTGKNSLQ